MDLLIHRATKDFSKLGDGDRKKVLDRMVSAILTRTSVAVRGSDKAPIVAPQTSEVQKDL